MNINSFLSKIPTDFFKDPQNLKNIFSFIVPKIISLLLFVFSINKFITTNNSEGLGVVLFFLALLNYQSLLDLGLGYAVFYIFTTKNKSEWHQKYDFINTTLTTYVIGFILIIAIFCISAKYLSYFFFFNNKFTIDFILFGILMGASLICSFFDSLLRSLNKIDIVNYLNLVVDLTKNLALWLIAMWQMSSYTFLILVIISYIIKILIVVKITDVYYAYYHKLRLVIDKKIFRELWKLSFPVFSTVLISMLFINADKLLVKRYFSNNDFVNYSLSVDLCTRAWFLFWAISSSYTNYTTQKSHFQKIDLYLPIISVMCVCIGFYLPIILFPKFVFNFLFGIVANQTMVLIIQILCLSSISYGVLCVSELFYKSYNQNRLLMLIYCVGGLIYMIGLTISVFQKQMCFIAYSNLFYILSIALLSIFVLLKFENRFTHES